MDAGEQATNTAACSDASLDLPVTDGQDGGMGDTSEVQI